MLLIKMKNSKCGIIFIPDISGFTEFVNSTDIDMGKKIISMLLAIIMHGNKLGFKVSEIEGDAILFYQYGTPIEVAVILKQFEDMLTAFYDELNAIQFAFPQAKSLSLKLIVHYGPIADFNLGGFNKLYGSAVVEAHQLLKNNTGQSCYVLITQAYLNSLSAVRHPLATELEQPKCLSQFTEHLGSIPYTCFPFVPPSLDRWWVT